MGFRNPFRLTIDPKSGKVLMGDYGPDAGTTNPNRGPQGSVEYNVVTPGNGDAEQRQAGDEHAGDHTRLEGNVEARRSDCEAAWAVRTLARTETFMPMNPAAPERMAPSGSRARPATREAGQGR